MKTDKTDNHLIEEFYVSQGGKPTLEADLSFYESSWDWLMPVVEKIDSLDDGKYIVIIDPMITIISENGEAVVNECQAFDGRIKNTYGAVVEFVKWYNQNKPL